jgi:radical SAM superfamily enzyme YgiQ (UPF0313 family)
MKILFVGAVNPFAATENLYPPLWPAYLSAYLEYRLPTVPFKFKFASRKIDQQLIRFNPDIVALSVVTQNYNYAQRYAKLAKRLGKKVIIGGMHVTSLPESLTKDIDAGCIGEGEVSFYEIVKQYLENPTLEPQHLKKIKGIVFYDGKKLVKTEERSVIGSLGELPHPKRSVVGYGYRSYVHSARGCPYACVFCACGKYWGKVRYTPAEYIVEEIQTLVDKGVKVIRFADDNFAFNKKRLKEIVAGITAKGLHRKAKFSCWCRADTINPETVALLKSMNVVSIKMGLESGCERTLKFLKGNLTVDGNMRAVDTVKDAGIQVTADFIIGCPEETEADIMETYQFIKRSRVDVFDVNIFTPLPGTLVWEMAMAKQLISTDMDWNRVNFKFNWDKKTAIVLSEKLSHSQLKRLFFKFQILRATRILKCMPNSPWLKEYPRIIVMKALEQAARFCRLSDRLIFNRTFQGR